MKVSMKAYEKKAIDHALKYKAWELQIAAKESYMAGYQDAKQDIRKTESIEVDYSKVDFIVTAEYNFDIDQEVIEVEFKDGAHQLTDDII